MSNDVAKLSKILFELDIANTCCKENECYDEYDSAALQIVEMIPSMGLADAIEYVFDTRFDVLPNVAAINKIMSEFYKE